MKYGVIVTYETSGYVEVEANSPEEAEEKAYEAAEIGDLEVIGQFDDPEYKFEVEEIEESSNEKTKTNQN
jgi:hypothetical protein